MKCINCYQNAVKENPELAKQGVTNFQYLRSVSGERNYPLFQRRDMICNKCGHRVSSLETLIDKPQILIDGQEYFKLKHIMSILEALGSRHEHLNHAISIVDDFMSECYQEAYKNPEGNSSYAKVVNRSKYNITRFTYDRLEKLVAKNKKWGIDANCAVTYACNHDFDVFLDCVIK